MRKCMGCMRAYDEQYDICPHCGYVYGTPVKAKIHLPPGTMLRDRYMLGKVLGQGGFGITYIAWDQVLEKPVAIKEFFPTTLAARMTGLNAISCFDPESKKVFSSGLQKMMNESRMLARFSDQNNIVQVLDCIEENGTAYIIMELLRGETVQSIILREGQLTLERTLQYMVPILRALDTIHQTGLVHRDVSPDNIFVCEDGTVKLLDFGAARIASGLDNKTLSVMLKKGYAPIEQYSSHGKQGAFTDVYAVCATMYAMLTGRTPENSLDRMAIDILRPISAFTDIPKPIEDVIMHGMAVDPTERIQSAGELYDQLRKAYSEARAAASAQEAEEPEPNPNPKTQPKPKPKSKLKEKTDSEMGRFREIKNAVMRDQERIKGILFIAVLIVVVIVCATAVAAWFLHRGKPLTSRIEVGDIVSFGSYGIEGESSQKIDWIVLDRSADQALLLSKEGLDCQMYHDVFGRSCNWKTCRIREWLNTEFYEAAFSKDEQERIVLHENVNPKNPIYGTSGCDNTFDRCFLLSLQEAEKYFPTGKERIAECTKAVSRRDYPDSEDKNIPWMLRSPGGDTEAASGGMGYLTIAPNGAVNCQTDATQPAVVRPAVWVDVDKNNDAPKSSDHSGDETDEADEWVSAYRDHLYDFSWELQDDVLVLSGKGVMPRVGTDEWDDTLRNKVRSVVIEPGLKTIACAAFEGCAHLTSVEIAESVEEIGFDAFRECASLKTISLPSSIKRIGQSAFQQSGVASNETYWNDGVMCIDHCLIRVSGNKSGIVTIPESISVIAEGAFRESSITGARIPYKVKRLDNAFQYCKQLQTVDLPDGVQKLYGTFDYCESLQEVRLPKELEIVESGFYGCEALRETEFPPSVRYIGEQAVGCCYALENVTMYSGMEQIEDSAFYNCDSLETVRFYGTKSDWDNICIEDGNENLLNAALKLKTRTDSPFAGLKKGDTVSFGKFEQDGNKENGAEPIEWVVVDTADKRQTLLLLSREVLDCRPYHTEKADVTWESCDVREWLNNTFYVNSFTSEEKAQIRRTTTDNPDNDVNHTRGGAKTMDSVWLLSLPQAQALDVVYTEARPTAYAVQKGAYKNPDTGSTWWFLRTPGSGNDYCTLVRSDGDIRPGGEEVNIAGGVRPAIWVSAS